MQDWVSLWNFVTENVIDVAEATLKGNRCSLRRLWARIRPEPDRRVRKEKSTGLQPRALAFVGFSRQLLKCWVRGRAGRSRVVADDARLVGAEETLSALSRYARIR